MLVSPLPSPLNLPPPPPVIEPDVTNEPVIIEPLTGDVTTNDVLQGSMGVVLNPNTELMFQGFKMRSFGLKYKMSARNELLMVDFLVIDEFDPRFMPTASSSDLFGRIMEDVFRCRAQNKLPIFMCTNSPNIAGSFEGSIGLSLSSLMNYVSMIPVLGKDFRKEGR